MRSALSGVGGLICLVCTTAHAQLYSCTDASGRQIVADRMVAECAERAMRELRTDGIVRRDIAPPLSLQERQRRQEEEAQALRMRREQKESQRRDEALLLRFRSVQDIASARERELEIIQDRIRLDRPALEHAQRQLLDAQTALRRDGAKASLALRDRAERAEHAVAQSSRLLEQHNLDVAGVNRKYDDIDLRYRQLTQQPGMPAERLPTALEQAGSARSR